MRTVAFRVEGMHCPGCAETMKALLEKRPGVHTAMVSFEGAEARILYDPAAATKAVLIGAIEKGGYRVTGESDD